MNKELKVGMYVRIKNNHGIAKITHKEYHEYDLVVYEVDKCFQYDENYHDSVYLYDDMVEESSYNIIDLIEVGDYVNGYEVVDIDNGYDIETEKTYKQLWTNGNAGYGDSIIIKESEINEVLTKEQYEREVFGV